MTTLRLFEILEELKQELWFLYKDPNLPPLAYKQIITPDINMEQEISLEIMPHKKLITVPQLMRNYIKKENTTITDLAQKIEITRPALTNFLNGKVALSFELAEKFSKLLYPVDPLTLLKIDIEVRYKFRKNKKIFLKDILARNNEVLVDSLKELQQPPFQIPLDSTGSFSILIFFFLPPLAP